MWCKRRDVKTIQMFVTNSSSPARHLAVFRIGFMEKGPYVWVDIVKKVYVLHCVMNLKSRTLSSWRKVAMLPEVRNPTNPRYLWKACGHKFKTTLVLELVIGWHGSANLNHHELKMSGFLLQQRTMNQLYDLFHYRTFPNQNLSGADQSWINYIISVQLQL